MQLVLCLRARIRAFYLFVTVDFTHHAVVAHQLQSVPGEDVRTSVHIAQSHLYRGVTPLSSRPTASHGEDTADVQVLLIRWAFSFPRVKASE